MSRPPTPPRPLIELSAMRHTINAKRVLAHRIEWGSDAFSLSVAEKVRDGEGRWHVRIAPFAGETAATVFHSGTVRIEAPDGSPFVDGSPLEPVFGVD